MAEIYETKEERERVILVGVDVDDGRQDDFIKTIYFIKLYLVVADYFYICSP